MTINHFCNFGGKDRVRCILNLCNRLPKLGIKAAATDGEDGGGVLQTKSSGYGEEESRINSESGGVGNLIGRQNGEAKPKRSG